MSGGEGRNSHVVVVGGGLAGLSAAIEASRHGAHVTIIEKEKNLGGNSAKATSGINGAETEAQKAMAIHDSIDKFVKDTLSSGDGDSSEPLVRALAEKSAAAHDWLRSFGLNLTDVVQLGGHGTKRTHRFPPPPLPPKQHRPLPQPPHPPGGASPEMPPSLPPPLIPTPAGHQAAMLAVAVQPTQTKVPAIPPRPSYMATPPTRDTAASSTADEEDEAEDNASNECSVCLEKDVDCVLYSCGHMCMCYECAMDVKNSQALCPICRQQIKDVIKIYRS